MNQKRRFLSLLIALVMVVGLVPAAAFAADDTSAVTAEVGFTSQLSGAFLHAPQFGADVPSDLAERYGYADQDTVTDGVSALDVLVRAHELVIGDDFTPDTADIYLQVRYGSPTMQFGVSSDEYYGGFFVNRAFPNDGTMGSYGYNGTVVGSQKVSDGDIVEFFFYEDEYFGDTYNWFRDADGNYSRKFTVAVGEELDLTLEGFYAMEASNCKDEAELVDFDGAYPVEDAWICIVDPATGALTGIEDAITDEDGQVTISFDEAGTYYIAAATGDATFTQLLTLTLIQVEAPEPADDATVTVTISNAGEVVVPFKEVTVKDLNADQTLDIDEVFKAAHDAFFTGGADAGYATGMYGIEKIWGVETSAVGYYNNGVMSWGLDDPVAEGDYVTAFIYKDKDGWSDSFAKFDKTSYTGEDSITATLLRVSGYDENYNTVFSEFPGAAITVYDEDYNAVDASKYTVTDNEDGTYTIEFAEAGSYLIQADNADPFIVPALAAAEITKEAVPAEDVKINVTINVKGEVIVPAEELAVPDADEDGDITIYDALVAAHEEWCDDGAAGIGASDSGWILKFWGEDGAAVGYYLNNAMAFGLTDPVAEGDYLVAYIFKDSENWGDAYAKLTGETDEEGVVTLTLEKEGFDADWNSVFEPFAGADIVVYDSNFDPLSEDAYTVTDNGDGTYTVELTESGDYIFVAYAPDVPLVPAVYRESVTVPDSQSEEPEPEKNDLEKIFQETGDALSEYTFEAGMEWMAFGLARAGRDLPGLDDYLASVEAYIDENANDNEQLATNRSSDNSRFILALTALAEDATKFADHDLIEGLSDITYVGKQGLNGYTWALLALDSHEYEEAEGATATREAMVAAVLAKQHEDGGWSLTDTFPASDVDITAMTLQALAPYYSEDPEVKAAVDKALEFLSGKQNEYGGFGSVDGASAESCAQVIVALTALGIDPATDERFVKNDWSVTDALSSYYLGNGQFSHVPGGAYNGLATEQAYYAMASYFRFKDGQTSLYDMTDVEFEEEYETPEGPIVKITDKNKEEVPFEYDDVAADILLTQKIAAEVNDKEDDPGKLEIIWQRDVIVPEGTEFPVEVEFKVDEKYKDQTIYIYHYDAEKKAWEVVGEGKYETFTVTFDSLSPSAMVARALEEAPNTGDASSAFLWAAMLAVAAAAGAAAIVTGRKRKED